MARRARRGQIIPLFAFVMMFIVIPICAALIDVTSYLSAVREADSLAWRGARMAAARAAVTCGAGGGMNTEGSQAPGGWCGSDGLAAVRADMTAYLASWLEGGQDGEMLGLRFSKAEVVSATTSGNRMVIDLRFCYRPWLAGLIVKGPASCGGDLQILARGAAGALLSN